MKRTFSFLFVLALYFGAPQSANAGGLECPNMTNAYIALNFALAYMNPADPVFNGWRAEAIEHAISAQNEIMNAMINRDCSTQGLDGYLQNPPAVSTNPDPNCQKMVTGSRYLIAAVSYLDQAWHIYNGLRADARNDAWNAYTDALVGNDYHRCNP